MDKCLTHIKECVQFARKIIETSTLPLKIDFQGDKYIIYDEYNIPVAEIIYFGGWDYDAYTLKWNTLKLEFEINKYVGQSLFEDIVKWVIVEIMYEKRDNFYNWTAASDTDINTIFEVENGSNS